MGAPTEREAVVAWLRRQSQLFHDKAEASVADRAQERLSRDLFAAKIALGRAADEIERDGHLPGDHIKDRP